MTEDAFTMCFDIFVRIIYRNSAEEPALPNCSQYEVMVVCEGRTWCTITCWKQAPNTITITEAFFLFILLQSCYVYLNTSVKHCCYWQKKCERNSSCTWWRVDFSANCATVHKKIRTANTQPELTNSMDCNQRNCSWRSQKWTACFHKASGHTESSEK